MADRGENTGHTQKVESQGRVQGAVQSAVYRFIRGKQDKRAQKTSFRLDLHEP